MKTYALLRDAMKAAKQPDAGGMSNADLMAFARKLDVTGRSAMSRADVEKAVRRAS